jgi:hypothetical protein
LTVFGGVTDRLIPLFAIGALLSFTLSQAGMVAHWRKSTERHSKKKMMINGLGATATGITAVIVLVTKFTEGAWLTLLMIPALLVLMTSIRRHYHQVALEVNSPGPLDLNEVSEPIVVVPVEEWNRVAKNAVQFALSMSRQVQVLHIEEEEGNNSLRRQWDEWYVDPGLYPGVSIPELVIITSPYRVVVNPIVNYVFNLERNNPNRQVAVVLSELVESNAFQRLLHNQRAKVLTSLFTRNGDARIIVVNVPWYFRQSGGADLRKAAPDRPKTR